MNDSFESDERKRKETIECLYWSLMNGWDIPKEIREYYGFSEDYELYHQLESMESAEYRLKRLECEVPDIVAVRARAAISLFATDCNVRFTSKTYSLSSVLSSKSRQP